MKLTDALKKLWWMIRATFFYEIANWRYARGIRLIDRGMALKKSGDRAFMQAEELMGDPEMGVEK